MRHQRCAGCLGGKAEFPCGLAGVDVGLYLIRSLSVWTFLELHVLERFPFGVTVEFVKIRFMGFLCLGDVV